MSGAVLRSPALRLPIAVKLALAIEVPLILLFAGALVWNFGTLRDRSLRENERWISAKVEAEAARFDGMFLEIAATVNAAALTLGEQAQLDRAQAHRVVRDLVGAHPEIYGSCLAFNPDGAEGAAALFAPYAYRPGGVVTEMDLASAYDYTSGAWEWYSTPAKSLRAVWTEPYFDEGAGNILMATYAAPVLRPDGTLHAVLTADVPLEPLQARRAGGREEQARFLIASSKGTLVSCPDPEGIGKNIYSEMGVTSDSPARMAVERLLAGETAVGLVRGFPSPGEHFLASAPIPTPGWRLGVSVSKDIVMAPVFAELRDIVLIRIAVIVAVLTAILALSVWLTRPVKRLHDAVLRVAEGDLEARAEGVDTRDELGDLAQSFNTMAARLRSQVDALAREMAARESVESELRVARQIQSSLLPRSLPSNSRFALAGFNAPARYVAGDFYDSMMEPADGSVLFAIADVSGKGVPAAMMMAVARTIFRDLAGRESAPDRIVAAANATLSADDSNGMFVTLVLARYDPENGALDYCNAGHPRPVLVRADGSVSLVGDITGTVVGAVPEAEFSAARIELRSGDRLVYYTDGVTEARAPDGRFFGEPGLLALLERHGAEPLEALCDRVRHELDEFQAGKRADDITLLILERRA